MWPGLWTINTHGTRLWSLPVGVDPEKATFIFERLIARGGALHSLTRVVTVSDPALLHYFDLVLDLVVSCELQCKPQVGLALATQLSTIF